MRRLLAGAAVLAVVLTGCVRVSTETTLSEDDTFSQHAILAMTDQARTALRQQLRQLDGAELPGDVDLPDTGLGDLDIDALFEPDTVREQLADLEEEHPGSVTVTPYSDDEGRSGVEIDIRDLPLETLDDATATTPFGAGTAIVRESDEFVVTLESGAASALGSMGGAVDQLGLFASAVEVDVAFTFPGLVREASAGEIAGNTVTLELTDLVAADTIRIVGGAESETDWGPIVRWTLVGLGAVVLIGGATALVLQDRRRRSSSALPPPRGSGDGPGMLSHDEPDEPAVPEEDADPGTR